MPITHADRRLHGLLQCPGVGGVLKTRGPPEDHGKHRSSFLSLPSTDFFLDNQSAIKNSRQMTISWHFFRVSDDIVEIQTTRNRETDDSASLSDKREYRRTAVKPSRKQTPIKWPPLNHFYALRYEVGFSLKSSNFSSHQIHESYWSSLRFAEND